MVKENPFVRKCEFCEGAAYDWVKYAKGLQGIIEACMSAVLLLLIPLPYFCYMLLGMLR